jgi:hypothetical protein
MRNSSFKNKRLPITLIPIGSFKGLSIQECILLLNSHGLKTPPDNYSSKKFLFLEGDAPHIMLFGEEFIIHYGVTEKLGYFHMNILKNQDFMKDINSSVPKDYIDKTFLHNPYGVAEISPFSASYYLEGKLLSRQDVLLRRIKKIHQ